MHYQHSHRVFSWSSRPRRLRRLRLHAHVGTERNETHRSSWAVSATKNEINGMVHKWQIYNDRRKFRSETSDNMDS